MSVGCWFKSPFVYEFVVPSLLPVVPTPHVGPQTSPPRGVGRRRGQLKYRRFLGVCGRQRCGRCGQAGVVRRGMWTEGSVSPGRSCPCRSAGASSGATTGAGPSVPRLTDPKPPLLSGLPRKRRFTEEGSRATVGGSESKSYILL